MKNPDILKSYMAPAPQPTVENPDAVNQLPIPSLDSARIAFDARRSLRTRSLATAGKSIR